MSLVEQALLNAPTFLAEGWLSVCFLQAFLIQKRRVRNIRIIWTVIYFLPTMLLFLLMDNTHPLAGILWVAERLIPLMLLQWIFFRFDLRKLLFLVISFLSGVYLLRYLITVLYLMAMDLTLALFYQWSMTMDFSTAQTAQEQLIFWQNALHLTQLGIMLLTSVLYIVLLWWYLRLLKNSFTRKDLPLTRRETLLLILPCLTAVTASFFIRMVIVSDADTPNLFYANPWSRLFVPLVSVLLLASIVAAVKLLQAEFAYREAAKQQILLDAQMKQMRTEIEKTQEMQDEMRAFKHDLRGHLANIAAYVRQIETDPHTGQDVIGRMTEYGTYDKGEQTTELDLYLTKMEEAMEELTLTVQTGNAITDVIVNRWMEEAKKEDVIFEAAFHFAEEKIDAYDMAVILNNALENAVTAAAEAKKTGGEGYVRLRSYRKESLYFIETENDYVTDILLDAVTELPRTTHEGPDEAEHGLGLQNIRRCAESYLGAMDIALSEEHGRKVFRLTVMLNTGSGYSVP